MKLKTGCPVCDEPYGIRGQALYPYHCPECHEYPTECCATCPCYGEEHHKDCFEMNKENI